MANEYTFTDTWNSYPGTPPTKRDTYLVTVEEIYPDWSRQSHVRISEYDVVQNRFAAEGNYKRVIAWMDMPEVYTP